MLRSLVGSEMCIRDRTPADQVPTPADRIPESLQVPQDAIRWSDPIDETFEPSPGPFSSGDDPAFDPNSLNQPPESPDAEEVLDSLLPDAPTPRNPDEPVDLDDLFSDTPDQPSRTERIKHQLKPKHSASSNSNTSQANVPDQKAGQSYRPWSYGCLLYTSPSPRDS